MAEYSVSRFKISVYPPPHKDWPWLVVTIKGKVVEAAQFETENEARTAMSTMTLDFARAEAEKEKARKR